MIYQRDTSVNLNIRHLEQEDFKEVAKIFSFKSVTENTSQNPFVNADMVASLFDSKDRYNLVALIDTEVVGYISLIMSSKARSKKQALRRYRASRSSRSPPQGRRESLIR